jgi:hypothetical protein
MRRFLFFVLLLVVSCREETKPIEVVEAEVVSEEMILSSGETQIIEFHYMTINGVDASVMEGDIRVGPYLKSRSDRGEDLPLSVYESAFPGAQFLEADFSSNCHALTFGRTLSDVLSSFWFNDPLAEMLIGQLFVETTQPQVGDAYMIRGPQGLHSGVISSLEGQSILTDNKLGEGRYVMGANLESIKAIYGDDVTFLKVAP